MLVQVSKSKKSHTSRGRTIIQHVGCLCLQVNIMCHVCARCPMACFMSTDPLSRFTVVIQKRLTTHTYHDMTEGSVWKRGGPSGTSHFSSSSTREVIRTNMRSSSLILHQYFPRGLPRPPRRYKLSLDHMPPTHSLPNHSPSPDLTCHVAMPELCHNVETSPETMNFASARRSPSRTTSKSTPSYATIPSRFLLAWKNILVVYLPRS